MAKGSRCANEKSPGKRGSHEGAEPIPFHGPVKPKAIKNDEELRELLDTLRRAAYEAAVLQAKLQADYVASLKEAKSARLSLVGAGTEGDREVGLAEYIERMTELIEEYGHCKEGETFVAEAGKVARRTNPDSVRFVPRAAEGTDDTPTERESQKLATESALSIELPEVEPSKEGGRAGTKAEGKWFSATVKCLLNRVLKRAGLSRFWKVSVSPDIAGAKAAYGKGEVTLEDLEGQGLEVVRGQKRIDISVEGCDLKAVREFLKG